MEEISELISVIVPVFNVETYLQATLDSILNQDIDGWELLLINDGSKDSSGDICDNYAQKDKRVKVIHTTNGGVSRARNIGLASCKGKYIVFCDSDDIIAPNYLSTLKNKMDSSDADIVRCACKFIDEDVFSYIEDNTSLEWDIYDKNKFSSLPGYMFEVVWGKMFKRSLITENQIEFDEKLTLGEDTLFAFKATLCSERILYSDNKLLNYRIRSNSLMRSIPSPLLYSQNVELYQNLKSFNIGQQKNPKLCESFCGAALFGVVESMVKVAGNAKIFSENYKTFCNDKAVYSAVKSHQPFFNKRTRLAVALMTLPIAKKVLPLIRLSIKFMYRKIIKY